MYLSAHDKSPTFFFHEGREMINVYIYIYIYIYKYIHGYHFIVSEILTISIMIAIDRVMYMITPYPRACVLHMIRDEGTNKKNP